jgi:hypothetical protein
VDQDSPPLTGERVDWQKTLSRVPYGAFQAADIYRQEQEHLFDDPLWHFLCLEIEVAQGGDFRICKVGDTPVVVSRDYDGEIYAFENCCAHRGAHYPQVSMKERQMPTITFVNRDGTREDVAATNGDSALQAATMQGVHGIVAECGGNAMCATCHVYVDESWLEER